MERHQKLVIDTCAFLTRMNFFSIGNEFITVPGVIEELKSMSIESISLNIEICVPDEEDVQKVICFSKKNGGYMSLSSVDIDLIALTLSLHKKNSLKEEEEIDENKTEKKDLFDSWICPGIVSSEQRKNCQKVVCVTNDYAMQNVLLGMSLPLVSLSGMKIQKIKTTILRCYGCYQLVSDPERQFCPKCGGTTLSRVTSEIDSAGIRKVFLSKNYKQNTKNTIYQLPKYNPKNKTTCILREDQSEYIQGMKKAKFGNKGVPRKELIPSVGRIIKHKNK